MGPAPRCGPHPIRAPARPGCSTSEQALLGTQQVMAQPLGPCTHTGDPEPSPSSCGHLGRKPAGAPPPSPGRAKSFHKGEAPRSNSFAVSASSAPISPCWNQILLSPNSNGNFCPNLFRSKILKLAISLRESPFYPIVLSKILALIFNSLSAFPNSPLGSCPSLPPLLNIFGYKSPKNFQIGRAHV